MPRMSKKRKHELSFYLNDWGRVTYNELCRKCQHGCKQSLCFSLSWHFLAAGARSIILSL